jgi:gliding motility-associated-like protein
MQKVIIFISLIIGINSAFAQTACGIINTYYRVVSVDTCNNGMGVTAKGLIKGERVVIMQMKGATAQLNNNSSFGSLTSIVNAGNYEFNVVSDVVNDSILTFSLKFLNTYDPTKAVQIIRFPAFRSVNTSCLLTCPPWNGQTGGVLVLYATDTIRIQSKIDVSGKGFRGSIPMDAGNCLPLPYTDYFTTAVSNLAGRKGEGVFVLSPSYECGRGKAVNAGGGGNEHNSGGGGGANYGAGGNGGERIKNILSCPGNYPGIGGDDLSAFYSNAKKNKIFMGGSGGCGHENNSFSAISGSGGGIAFIIAKIVKCNNDSILANGTSISAHCIEDGGSGGGAGGVIILKTDSVYGKVFLSVKGGFGQSTDNSAKNECYGPGGGGGGGVITTSTKKKVSNQVFDTTAGNAGITYNSLGACNNTTNSATNGVKGHIIYNYIYNENPVIFRKFNVTAGADLTICKGDSVQLNANQGLSFEWSPNYNLSDYRIKNPLAKPDTTTLYVVRAYDSCSYSYDTVKVTVTQPPHLLHSPDTSICYGDTIQLFVSGALAYTWLPATSISNTTSNAPFVWPSTSTYYLIKASNGTCEVQDTIHIKVVQAPVIQVAKDTSLCIGDKFILHATGAFRYVWEPNINISDTSIADPEITAQSTITYTVTGYNTTGCPGKSKGKVTIEVHSCIDTTSTDTITIIPNVFTPNNDGVNDFYEIHARRISEFSIVIFNRWGQSVFTSTDPNFKWNGNNTPDGIYYFVINYTDFRKKKIENKGTVTLIR